MLNTLAAVLNKPSGIAVCAHRGNSSEAPENTRAAYESACALGVDLVEVDVRLAKDRELVIFHDNELHRTTNGAGIIEERASDELRRLDAGSWFNPSFSGERIPTLKEALEVICPRSVALVEIKIREGYYDLAEMAESLLRVIAETPNARVILQSFHADILKEIWNLEQKIPLAFLTSDMRQGCRRRLRMWELKASTLSFARRRRKPSPRCTTVECGQRPGPWMKKKTWKK